MRLLYSSCHISCRTLNTCPEGPFLPERAPAQEGQAKVLVGRRLADESVYLLVHVQGRGVGAEGHHEVRVVRGPTAAVEENSRKVNVVNEIQTWHGGARDEREVSDIG